jgi:hypothetical protein
MMHGVVFSDRSDLAVSAVFTKANFKQHCNIPAHLGCELTEQGLLKRIVFVKHRYPEFMQPATILPCSVRFRLPYRPVPLPALRSTGN